LQSKQDLPTSDYDNALVPNKVVANPSLEKTIIHETGHAFDFSFTTNANQGSMLSNLTGFVDLATKDKLALTPSAWSGWSNFSKDENERAGLVITLLSFKRWNWLFASNTVGNKFS
jgi:hypothetical protein